jgi:hypothetical protein
MSDEAATKPSLRHRATEEVKEGADRLSLRSGGEAGEVRLALRDHRSCPHNRGFRLRHPGIIGAHAFGDQPSCHNRCSNASRALRGAASFSRQSPPPLRSYDWEVATQPPDAAF